MTLALDLYKGTFTTPIASSSRSSSVDNPSQSQTLTIQESLFRMLYTDDSDEEVPDLGHLDEKI